MNHSPGRGDTTGFLTTGFLCHPSGVPLSHVTFHTRVNTRAYSMSPLPGLGASRHRPLPPIRPICPISPTKKRLHTRVYTPCLWYATPTRVGGITSQTIAPPFVLFVLLVRQKNAYIHGFTHRACDMPPLPGLGASRYRPLLPIRPICPISPIKNS